MNLWLMKAQCKVNSLVTHLLQNKVNKLSKYLNPFINCFIPLYKMKTILTHMCIQECEVQGVTSCCVSSRTKSR